MPGLSSYQHTIDTESVIINREARQRSEIDDLGGLISDIARNGLLNPIIISRKDKRLIAGERRITSFKTLAAGWSGDPADNPWKRIPFRYYDELTEFDAQIIELSENLHRKELSWRDMAVSVYRIHQLRLREDPNHTQGMTATEIGVSDATVSTHLAVGAALTEGKLDFSGCASAQAAYNIIKRIQERETDALMASLTFSHSKAATTPAQATAAAPASAPARAAQASEPAESGATPLEAFIAQASAPAQNTQKTDEAPKPQVQDFASSAIIQADFGEWAKTYSDQPFNLLHIDFPYGINFGESRRQNTASDRKAYDDSPDLFWKLCRDLRDNLDRVVAESAHIMFWFSLGLEPTNDNTAYERIVQFFRAPRDEGGCGLTVNPFPLIWCRNGSILPDPNRGPRRGYETALLMTRGDRKIVRPVQNFFEDSDRSEKSTHTSEKPQAMLNYFLSMLVDDTSRVLDPTAGSGSAIRAAHKLGASHVLGLEINPEFVELARGKIRSDEMASSLLENFGDF